ncbi:tyrosine-type recombinase/integrase [Murimonas intestini]|uniref:tyrosine-type recombinase/integrase n=1 Tax=Murimonas intestini TaxID=1337051 RepID=UPI00214B050D|nr:site-specific integrase [Murimonas intestini]MCR1864789.1 site-specific integrase [Murimonas intestini]
MSRRKISFMSLLEDYFETYLPYSRGLSRNTIGSYKQSFLLLIRFMLDVKSIAASAIKFSDLTYETLLEFFDWLETDRNCKPTTRNQRLSALSAFSEYAQNRDFDAASIFRSAIIKIPVKKSKQKQRATFTREEIKILLILPDENYETGLRNKVMLSLMYATGARAQEICDLKVGDMRISTSSAIITLTGKGSKTRQIGISKKLGQSLQKYIFHRHIEKHPERHIFSSQTHEQMTISCVEGIYKKYVSIAKEQHPTLFRADSYPPHSMRHSTACHLLEAGVDIVTIKNILGHVSVQTTQIYAEMSQDTVDKKLKEWNETWFGNNQKIEIKKSKDNIPDFLKNR